MNATNGIVYNAKAKRKSGGMKLPPLLAVLWDQIDDAFPKATRTDAWKRMNPAEKTTARRELFRLLYGASPEFLYMKLKKQFQGK